MQKDVGCGTAIRILHELATVKDINRLNAYCKNNKYNEYLGGDDLDAYESWSCAFQGERLYYLIHYGISGREAWEPEAEELLLLRF